MNLIELNEEHVILDTKITEIKRQMLDIALPILTAFKDFVDENPELYHLKFRVDLPTEDPKDFIGIKSCPIRKGYVIDYATWTLGAFDEINYFVPGLLIAHPNAYIKERQEAIKKLNYN